jgi:hypothetical protein
MGDDDMADMLAGIHCGKNCVQMGQVLRAGINHGQRSFAKQISIGATVSHGGRIGRYETAQTALKHLWCADWWIKVVWWLHRLAFRLVR